MPRDFRYFWGALSSLFAVLCYSIQAALLRKIGTAVYAGTSTACVGAIISVAIMLFTPAFNLSINPISLIDGLWLLCIGAVSYVY
jgi:hypothetical protein